MAKVSCRSRVLGPVQEGQAGQAVLLGSGTTFLVPSLSGLQDLLASIFSEPAWHCGDCNCPQVTPAQPKSKGHVRRAPPTASPPAQVPVRSGAAGGGTCGPTGSEPPERSPLPALASGLWEGDRAWYLAGIRPTLWGREACAPGPATHVCT